MNRKNKGTRSGFTLLEIMLVIVVIAILMSMLGAAAYTARQRAYASTATAETQQIATAFKSYYLAFHKWPKAWASGKAWTPLTAENLAPLLGTEDGGGGRVFLDLPENRLEDGKFLDPWGHPYEVQTDAVLKPNISDTFEGAVSFPNHMRHYGEDGLFTKPAGTWDWDDYN